jgi:hypothetical protein
MTENNKATAIAKESKSELRNTKGMVVGKDRIERFQTAFRGEIIQPTDFGYESARKIWNASIDKRPGIVARCAGVALIHTPEGVPAVAVVACYCGDLTEGEKVLKPLRSFGSPILDAIQPIPFPQMQTLLDGAFPDGNHNYWKSTFLRDLSDDAIALVVEQANRATSSLTGVVIEYYGGAASRIRVSETAFAQRQAQYSLIFLAPPVNCCASRLSFASIFDGEVSDYKTAGVCWPAGGSRVSGASSSCSWEFGWVGPRAEPRRTLFGPVLVARVLEAGQLRCRLHVHLHSEFGAAIDGAETYQ